MNARNATEEIGRSKQLVVTKSSSFLDRLIIGESSYWKAIFDIWISLMVGYSCFTSIY